MRMCDARLMNQFRELFRAMQESEESLGFKDGELRDAMKRAIAKTAELPGPEGGETALRVGAWLLEEADDGGE